MRTRRAATARADSGQRVGGQAIALVELSLDQEAGPQAVDGPEPLPAWTRAVCIGLVVEVASRAQRWDQRGRRREVGHGRGGAVAPPRRDVHAAEEPRRELDVGAARRPGHGPGADGPVEEVTRLVEGSERLRVLRRPGELGDGLDEAIGALEVLGDDRSIRRGVVEEHVGDAAVHPPTDLVELGVVGEVGEQLVTEPVAVLIVRVRDQDPCVDERGELSLELGRRRIGAASMTARGAATPMVAITWANRRSAPGTAKRASRRSRSAAGMLPSVWSSAFCAPARAQELLEEQRDPVAARGDLVEVLRIQTPAVGQAARRARGAPRT